MRRGTKMLTKPRRRYVVHERVVFTYVYVVVADNPEEAAKKIETVGDGEAVQHNELTRKVILVERAPSARRSKAEEQWEVT